MYTRKTFLLLFTWFLTVVRYANSSENKGGNKKIHNGINNLDPEWPVKVIKCFERQHVVKCFQTLLEEKSKTYSDLDRIKEIAEVSVARAQSSPAEQLTLKKVTTLMDTWRKSLAVHIKQEVSDLLKKENVTSIYDLAMRFFNKISDTSDKLQEGANNNNTVTATERKMKMQSNIQKMIPYMLVPGLFLAGVMPWVVPQIKMLVMMVTMLNQVAFSSALFSLVRGYVFETAQNEHIFYINHGYKNEKHHPQKHKGLNRNDTILKNPKNTR